MAKQKNKQAKKLAKKAAQATTPASSSQEETNRLLSGSTVERDEDIDVQSQAVTASTPKKKSAKAKTPTPLKPQQQEEVFDLGLAESPKQAEASSSSATTTTPTTTETRGKKRKLAAAVEEKPKKSRKPKTYNVLNTELTKSQLEGYDLMVNDQRIFSKSTILRLIKDIVRESHPDFRISVKAFEILHEVLEHELTDAMFIANVIRMTHKKITLQKGDLVMASLIKKLYHPRETLSMHTSYALKELLGAYNVKATIGSENLPLENLGELAQGILNSEKSAKAEKYRKERAGALERIKKAAAEASEDTGSEAQEEEEQEQEEPAAPKNKGKAKASEPPKKKAKVSKKASKKTKKSKNDEDEGAQSEQEV